jgi:hypothetical protein
VETGDVEAIDRAIADFMNRGDSDSERNLSACGEPGLRRMLELYFGDSMPQPGSPIPKLTSRWLAEQWTAALAVLAKCAPDRFVEALSGRDISVSGPSLVSILGGIRTPAATKLLCEQLHSNDWLVGYNALRSLVRAADPGGRPCIVAGLQDPNLVVRSVAIKGVSRWDPARAAGLYEDLLRAEGLTPLLRQQATWAIGELRLGREVRDPLDPI